MARIKNNGNGSWYITLSGGYDEEGKQVRIYRTFHANPDSTENSQRKQAEKYAAQLETDYSRKLITDEKKIRFSEVAKEYLVSKPIAERTKQWYKQLLDGRILPALGNVYVQDLTSRRIRSFLNDLASAKAKLTRTKPVSENASKSGKKSNQDKTVPGSRSKNGKLSGTYRLHYYRVISAILQFAVRSGYIAISPMNGVDPPRKDTQEAEFLEANDIANLIDALDDLRDPMWRAFFYLDLYSSCRPGELIALDWSDLKDNILTIQAGSQYIKGKGTVRTDRPKTKASIRTIVLPQNVIDILNTWHAVQNRMRIKFGKCWPEPKAMFTGDLGHRLDINSPTQKWRKIQKQYNLKDVSLYSLRHTGASLLIASGCDIKEVSGRLGHSRASTTLDIYTHLFEKAAQHTIDVLTSAIDAARADAKKKKTQIDA